MSLAKIPTDHQTVDIGGQFFDVRVLTRGEAARMRELEEAGDRAELEIAVIAAATDTPLDEARQWYRATPTWAVEELIGHVMRISRLDEGAQKSSGTGDRPGDG